MYISQTEAAAVEAEARRHGINGDAEAVVKQAFVAILHGEAEDVAYSVTEAAGISWLTPSTWYKRRTQVNADQARELLTQGRKDGTYEAPIPEDDAKAISEAEDLVDMATTAWNQHVRGPEVEILLKMHANFEEGGEPEPKSEPKPEPTPEPEEPAEDQEEEGGKPEPEPESEEPQTGEPWHGYSSERVSQIIDGINAGAREYSQEEFVELMGDVWNFESANKNRSTIIKHLEEIARKLQAGEPLVEDEEQKSEEATEPEPEEEPAVADEPEETEPEETEPKPEEEPAVSEEPEEKPKRKRRKKIDEDKQEGSDDEERDLLKQVEEDLDRERLHKPKHPEEDIPDLPWDWTKMTDKELQKFHGIYSAVAYYKNYLLVKNERLALHCKAAADELHNLLIVSLEKIDEHGKEKKVAVIEAEVESDENVVKWRRRQRKYETFAANHRNERDSIAKIVEALSRHETMRHDEWERSMKGNRQK